MASLDSSAVIGVLGAGTMGSGIAQVAAQSGHRVIVIDTFPGAIERASAQLNKHLNNQIEKGRITEAAALELRAAITFSSDASYAPFIECSLIIEAIIEDLSAKQRAFSEIEKLVAEDCILATNTSSLAVTAIAAACTKPARVAGLHFFNPVPLMALVEVVPGLLTAPELIPTLTELCRAWGKIPVTAKDTPGFIVNRVARPFYGESLRILEEGIADCATIDWALRTYGGFKMGPFELMDLIGNDINYAVTCSVFESFYYDPRYRPSITQRRMVEGKLLGRKTKRGYYQYTEGAPIPAPTQDETLGKAITDRVLAMLINEAAEALYLRVATAADLELSMTKGVNYPHGLLAWGDKLGAAAILKRLTDLQSLYGEDRYRPSVLLRRAADSNTPLLNPFRS